MRSSISSTFRWLIAGFLFLQIFGSPIAADAADGAKSGNSSAYGTYVDLHLVPLLLPGIDIPLGPTPTVSGSAPPDYNQHNEVTSVNLVGLPLLGDLLTTGVNSVNARSDNIASDMAAEFVYADAAVLNPEINVLGLLSIGTDGTITSSSEVSRNPDGTVTSKGASDVADLAISIGGVSIPIPLNPSPNYEVPLAGTILDGVVGAKIVLNEQTETVTNNPDGTITRKLAVNALHVYLGEGGTLLGIGVLTGDIVIAHSEAELTPLNLWINKTDSPDPAIVGQDLTYMITVKNTGWTAQDNVVVTDILPASVTYISSTPSQGNTSEASGTVTATLGAIAPNNSATVEIKVRPTQTGTISNTASVTSSQYATTPVQSNEVLTDVGTGLIITKSGSPNPAIVGQELTYTIIVTNTAATAQTGVVVTDVLLAGVSYVSSTSTQGSVSEASGTVTATLGTIDPGANATVTIVVVPTQAGTISNTASAVSDTQTTPVVSAPVVTTVIGIGGGLTIYKTATPSPAIVGQDLTYTITVTNTGATDQTNVVVTDPLLAGVNYKSSTSSQGTTSYDAGTVTANLGTIAAGASATVTIVVVPTQAGMILLDVASVVSDQQLIPAVTPPVLTQVGIGLTITKTASPDPAIVGQDLTYTITVTNTGTTAQTGVVVTDILPLGVTYKSSAASPSGTTSYVLGTVTANLGTIASGASATVTIVVVPTQVGQLSNVASVISTQQLIPLITPPVLTQVGGGLAITKTASTSLATVGQNLTYTITVSNTGTAAQNNVVVTDILLAGVSYVSSTSSQGSTSQDSGTVTANLGTIAAGASATVTIVVVPTQTGTISNTASVTSTQQTTPVESAPVETIVIGVGGGLAITKTALPSPAIVGQDLTYTITVINTGTTAQTGVVVTDPLLAGVNYKSSTSSQGTTSYSAGTVTANLGTIASGASATVTIVVVPTQAGMLLVDVASVISDQQLIPAVTPPVVTLVESGLTITKTAWPDPAIAGQDLTYTITVTNNGTTAQNDVVVTDILPLTATYESSTSSQGSTSQALGTVTANLGTIAAGASATVTIVVKPIQAGLPLLNVASVISDQQLIPVVTPLVTTQVEAGLTITKAATPSPAIVGQDLTYTITVTNNGTTDQTNVVVTDILPLTATYKSSTSSQGSTSQALGTVTANLGTIAAGGSATVTIVVEPTLAGVLLTNEAVVTSTQQLIPVIATPVVTEVVQGLTITKTATPSPAIVGQDLTYTITVTNNGTTAQNNVVVTDILPLTATYKSSTSSQGSTSQAFGTVTANLGTIAAGGSATVTIVVTPTLAGVPLTNVASVISTQQLIPVIATPVVTEVMQGLTITKTASPDPAIVGQDLTYTITVTNNGTTDQTNVVVTDILPLGVMYKSSTSSQGTTNYVLGTVTANLGTSASGASATVTIVVVPTQTLLPLTNVASVISTQQLIPVIATVVTQVESGLTITKTASPDSVPVGQDLTYTITVTNNGTTAQTGVVVTDVLSAGVDYKSGASSQGIVNYDVGTRTVTASLGTLASGASATVTIVVTPTQVGQIENVASVASDRQQTPVATPPVVTVVTGAEGGLTITKTATPSPAIVGQNLTYTITVANTGIITQTGVVVTDTLPATVTYKSMSTNPDGAAVTHPDVDATGTVTATFATLASGASATVAIVVVPTQVGQLSNVASVVSDQQTTPVESDPPTVTDVESGLTITKTAAPSPAIVGQDLTYTITVTNNGSTEQTNLALTDVLPDTVTFKSSNLGTYDPATRTVTASGKLAPGLSAIVTIVVVPTQVGQLSNVASVVSDQQTTPVESDPVVTNVEGGLTITKTASPDPVIVGQDLTYTITVTNTGTTEQTNVVMMDRVPEGVIYDPAKSTPGLIYDEATRTVTASATTLAPGVSATVTIVVVPTQAGEISNVAGVVSDQQQTPVVTSPVVTEVESFLTITKEASPSSVTVGQDLTYTITVVNNSDSISSTNTVVTDVLPAEVEYESSTSSQGTTSYDAGTRTVTASLGTIAAGESATVTIVVVPNQAGNFENVAVVDSDEISSNPPQSDPVRTEAGSAALYVTKTASKDVVGIGDFVGYELKVKDVVDHTVHDAVVTDKLPVGFRYQEDSVRINGTTATDPSVSSDGRTLTFSIGDIPDDEEVTISYVVEVSAGARKGDAINQASAAGSIGTGSGGVTSNIASVTVKVREDLFRSKCFIMGRVIADNCQGTPKGVNDGVQGVRVYLEDGTYVVTDKEGKFHFEGVKPGVHVVQLDLETLPEQYEVIPCEKNTRFAGKAFSQFVDIQGGTMWRTDFRVAAKPGIKPEIAKQASASTIILGEDLTYTITVANTSDTIAATNEVVIDVLPAGVDYKSSASSQGKTSYDSRTREVKANLGAIRPLGKATVTIVVVPTKLGKITNVSSVTTDKHKSPVETSPVVVEVTEGLVIAKTGDTAALVGQDLKYTLIVRNKGAVEQTSTVVSDPLPAEVDYKSSTSSQGSTFYDFRTHTVTAKLGTVAAGGTATVSIVVIPTQAGEIENISMVDSSEMQKPVQSDPLISNVSGSLLITKTANPDPVSLKQDLTYTVTVKNPGSIDQTNVEVNDLLPAGVDFKSATSSQGSTLYDSHTHTVTAKLGTIVAGDTAIISIIVIPVHAEQAENSANVISDQQQTPGEVSSATTIQPGIVTGKASLQLRSALYDGLVYYQAKASGSMVELKNVRLTLLLPEGITYVAGSSALGKESLADPIVKGNTLTYSLGDVPREWTKDIYFKGKLSTGKETGEFFTKGVLAFDSPSQKDQYTPEVNNVLTLEPKENRSRQPNITVRPQFAILSAELREEDKKALDEVAAKVKDLEVIHLYVIGHTCTLGIGPKGRKLYADNYALSKARAESIANYLVKALGLSPSQITVEGKGPDQPIASNKTEKGRVLNRRVEVTLVTDKVMVGDLIQMKKDVDSVEVETKALIHGEERKLPERPPIIKKDVQGTKSTGDKKISGRSSEIKGASGSPSGEEESISERSSALIRESSEAKYAEDRETSEGSSKLSEGMFAYSTNAESSQGTDSLTVELLGEKSLLIADGRTCPVIAVRLTDKEGNPLNESKVGSFSVDPPYASQQVKDELQKRPLDKENPSYIVGKDGVALIKLGPTSQTGEAVLHFRIDGSEEEEEVRVWLKPEDRDWILVGLAEGTAGYNTVDDNMEMFDATDAEEDFYTDGRIALFAKGKVKGKWLLTLAYDSEKNTNDEDNNLFGTIDPDTYYTLYGDATNQAYDAASIRKLYVKIERGQFYALFGDYNTGLTVTELSRYSRSLNGVKVEKQGETFGFNVFGAETDQGFIREEIRGDGTSGLYQLSQGDILINSEKITIETRDRFHSENIISSKQLTRHIDYNIDYDDGTLFFKEPIYSKDEDFNPIFIVADYETRNLPEDAYTYGGRGSVKLMDGKLEVGGTYISEDQVAQEGELMGTDITLNIGENTQFKGEFATSEAGPAEGDAYLAEVTHSTAKLKGSVYIREQDEEFGLGHQNLGESGTKKIGADAEYQMNKNLEVSGEAYRQENLEEDAERDVLEAKVKHEKDNYDMYVGYRQAEDSLDDGTDNQSDQALVGASVKVLDDKVKLRADHEQSLSGKDENVDYPTRTILGADYALTDDVTLFADQEFTSGEYEDTQSTRAGMKATPWKGGEVGTSLGREYEENGERLFANLGLAQTWKMDEHWSFDAGFDSSRTVKDSGYVPFDKDVPPASGSDEDFVAISLGAAYRADTWSWTSRIEQRYADSADKWGVATGIYGEVRDGLGLSLGTQVFKKDATDGTDSTDGDVRFGLAYRPLWARWIVLDRLDFIFEEEEDSTSTTDSWRLVNNTHANYKFNKTQISLQYGAKYVNDEIDGDTYTGYTDLFGLETRYDITEQWDVGLRASILHSWNTEQFDYSTGASLGRYLAKNMWLSVGYNFVGFEDEDFSKADFTAQGPYVKFRMKFDQESLQGILESIE